MIDLSPWEQTSLDAYCAAHGITAAEQAAAQAHAAVGTNALYFNARLGWIVGSGNQPRTLAYVHEDHAVYDYPYERVSLVDWVTRYRAQQASNEHTESESNKS